MKANIIHSARTSSPFTFLESFSASKFYLKKRVNERVRELSTVKTKNRRKSDKCLQEWPYRTPTTNEFQRPRRVILVCHSTWMPR